MRSISEYEYVSSWVISYLCFVSVWLVTFDYIGTIVGRDFCVTGELASCCWVLTCFVNEGVMMDWVRLIIDSASDDSARHGWTTWIGMIVADGVLAIAKIRTIL